MHRLSARAGPVRLMLIAGLVAALAVPAIAQQPDPAPAPKVQVETTYVNLSQVPTFRMEVKVPMEFHFAAADYNGMKILQVIGIVRLELLTRVNRAASYLDRHESIFTPLIAEPPNRPGEHFATLRDLTPERRLSYNRRLT